MAGPDETMAAMSTLIGDVEKASRWIADALRSSGYVADFSGPSLWEVDRFFDDNSAKGRPRPGGLLAEGLGARLFALGAYVGQTVQHQVGGTWQADDNDPAGEVNIEFITTAGATVWPVQRAMKRLANGAEESIGMWGLALGVSVGNRPAIAKPTGLFRRNRRLP